jgi:hypothetical protein
MSRKLKYWIIGVVVAATGLILARVVSPAYADRPAAELTIFLAGAVVAMAGLGIILLGLRKP